MGGAILAFVLYVLSYGPATFWVVSAVSGKKPSELHPEVYDVRLDRFLRVYDPVIRLRRWLYWNVGMGSENVFLAYDHLYARPRFLTDGREVITFSSHGRIRSGETPAHYIGETLGFGDISLPKPGTQLFNLRRTHRTLVILAKGGDDDASLALSDIWDPPWPTVYACLNAP